MAGRTQGPAEGLGGIRIQALSEGLVAGMFEAQSTGMTIIVSSSLSGNSGPL